MEAKITQLQNQLENQLRESKDLELRNELNQLKNENEVWKERFENQKELNKMMKHFLNANDVVIEKLTTETTNLITKLKTTEQQLASCGNSQNEISIDLRHI